VAIRLGILLLCAPRALLVDEVRQGKVQPLWQRFGFMPCTVPLDDGQVAEIIKNLEKYRGR
jgi:hypothetical protein